ncbi:MAG: hypothetical protein LBP76_09380 [Treponema sp.]|jgi:hypothetical protein|nr:hypothetical protein [Treponema sp.]
MSLQTSKKIGKIPVRKVFNTDAYAEFVDYCTKCHVSSIDEVSQTVLATFKSKYNRSSEEIENIKVLLNTAGKGEDNRIQNNINENKSVSGKSSKNHKEKAQLWIPGYSDPIEILNLSTRSTTALKNVEITTVEKLLNLDYQSLYAIRSIGKKSAEEILACQKKLVSYGLKKENDNDQNSIISLHDPIANLNMSVRSTKALNNHGINTIEKFLELKDQELYDINNIGKKSIEEIISNRNNIKKTSEYKDVIRLSSQQKQLKQLNGIFQNIPKSRLGKSFHDYLSCMNGLDTVINRLHATLESIHTINDVSSLFESLCLDDEMTEDFLLILDILALDLKKYINGLIKKMFSKQKYDRVLKVLQKRIKGDTLQKISNEMGLTRERIRQIENKGGKLLLKHLNGFNINIFAFINIDYNCKDIITINEMDEYLNGIENLDLFMYILKTKRIWDSYSFNKRLNIFYNERVITDIDAVSNRIAVLSDIIEEDKKDDILLQISRENNFSLKLIMIEFSSIYRHSGKVYVKGKLSLARIYDYILEKYYPAGIKLFKDSTIEQFKKRITEIFGANNFSESNRAIYAKIPNQAVLCDRGMYIHPKYIVINRELIEEIDTFIAASHRKVISFNELFETFKQKLFVSSNIKNRYFLQGALNFYLGKKYFLARDTISKENDADFTDEIESYIRTRGEVYKAEVFAEFNGISQIVFSMRTKYNKNIIYLGNGLYMHADRLKLEKNDYQMKHTIAECVKKNPVSSRKMLELFRKAFPQFLTRNNIETHEKLFGILKFMFNDDFCFSRPYIAKLGVDEISNKTVIHEYLQSYNSITIPELVELCEEHQLKYFSIRNLIKNLNDEFLRINSDTLVRVGTEIDENIIVETEKLLLEKIDKQGFLVASKIDDYILFPKTKFEWNPFLLRSIVEKYLDDTININDIPTTDVYAMNSVFTDPQMEIDNYESLLRNILTAENNNEPFSTTDEAINWLKEQGLIMGNVPRCLLDEGILLNDESGRIIGGRKFSV